MRTAILILLVAIFLVSCATSQSTSTSVAPSVPASKIEASEATQGCSVYVYRNKTSFESLNFEKPFVYVGDERVGKLGTGDSICLRMAEGRYTVSVKAPIAFMPAFIVGKVEVEVIAGAPVYVRYAKEFTGVVVSGANASTTGSNKVQVVTEAQWRGRL